MGDEPTSRFSCVSAIVHTRTEPDNIILAAKMGREGCPSYRTTLPVPDSGLRRVLIHPGLVWFFLAG